MVAVLGFSFGLRPRAAAPPGSFAVRAPAGPSGLSWPGRSRPGRGSLRLAAARAARGRAAPLAVLGPSAR
ncbi:hypothetical protein C3R44_24190, partial [Mycobacterium tuberculosis]